MRRRDSLKSIFAWAAILWLGWHSLGAAPLYAGWKLMVTFTTTSPKGELNFEPQHVQAVWVENAASAFVKTIGRWGVIEHRHLTQWNAADGTNLDGFTGATPKAYQQHTITWDLTDRSGTQVPDGTYYIRFELTNHNATKNQFHRATFTFVKDGNPRSQFYPSQGGFLNVTLDYKFTPTVRPQVTNAPARYITGNSARLRGEVLDTGGEDPNVQIYWGENDGGTDVRRWDYLVELGPQTAGALCLDLTDLDAATKYYYRLYAQNSAGGQWTDSTVDFSTNGPTGYYTGYRVQSGRTQVQGSRFDVEILPVNDTGRAFALFSYGTGWQPGEENANVVMARSRLLDTDTLRIERTSPANSTWVSWEVIECLGREFQVYRGSGSLGNEQSSADAALSNSQIQTGWRVLAATASEVRVDPS
ncbi:MAG: DUF2271 domain-containing protein, partial [Planctomycetaceae bacterium]